MNIAFCHESVLPARGGCETYIADLTRRLARDGHEIHLYACRWDAGALPPSVRFHALPAVRGPRFLRHWRFGAACLQALETNEHDVSVGFDKTWGQDVIFPQGGLHSASAQHTILKYRGGISRSLARAGKWFDLAHWSFKALERRQYLGVHRPLIVVNSEMVQQHFQRYLGIEPADVRVVRSAIDPDRFVEHERLRRRSECRQEWGVAADDTVALFVAMNYRLKGLEPLLHAVGRLPDQPALHLLVAGQPRTDVYQRLARRLGISRRVHFLGPRQDVQNCYFAADLLIHPTFYDPCSLVVLEALACGLPVITTRFNGASELLHPPREGYVVDNPQDDQELAHCMVRLLDPARRSACAKAARVTAAQWTFEHHYRRLLQVLIEAAARRRAAS
jgi:UDP-glucose:(heptosyl)LPS alpha-1,3-glucosyltransferase